MASMKGSLFTAAGVCFLVGSFAGAIMANEALPSLNSSDLAQGPFSYMHMLLQKTFIKINIATVEVRVDKPTQNRLAGMARGQAYSEGLAQQLTHVTIGAERAVVQMQFKRDISLDRWMGFTRDNIGQARAAGFITADIEKRASQSLPQSFAALKSRGYQKGDRLIYSVAPGGLRMVVVSAGEQVFIDRMDTEQGAQRVVLAAFFAPGSDFREPLLRSLLEAAR